MKQYLDISDILKLYERHLIHQEFALMNLSLNADNLTPTDAQYRELIADVLENGSFKGDRTGTGTYAVVGRMARYSLLNGRSPRPTTKEMKDTPERELLWFVSGSSSIKELRDQKIGIWNSWLIQGSAKYETLTFEEVEKAICKKLSVDFFNLSIIYDDVRDALDLMDFTGDLHVSRHTADKGATVFFAKSVWDGFVRESCNESREIATYYIAGWLDISTKRLIDGDIGPGGYGPQWRHWKDTQMVPQSDVEEYRVQGYSSVGVAFEGQEAGLEALSGAVVMYREIDQLQNAINLLRTDPNSRRIIVTAWNPALTWKAALPPCHQYFQFISHELTLEQRYAILKDRVELGKYDVKKEEARTGIVDTVMRTWNTWTLEVDRLSYTDEELHKRLDVINIHRRGLYCFLLLRSNDAGLGKPYNVAQYASLTHMVAQCVNMAPLELVWAAVDFHVYTNHVEALQKQLTLESKDCIPRIKLNKAITEIDDFTIDDIEIIDYDSHEALTKHMPVAV